MIKSELETGFTVYPQHLNDSPPLIFGGAFFGEMDKVAQRVVKRWLELNNSDCKNAVTHIANVKFHGPCYLGDWIDLEGVYESHGPKSVVVYVRATKNGVLVAETEFVFVSILNNDTLKDKPKLLPYHRHGIEQEEKRE